MHFEMALLLHLYFPLLLDFLLHPTVVAAQATVQQIVWNVPNGQEPDFSNTFYAGNTVPISWNELGGGNTAAYDSLDLWVTTFDYSVHQYSQLLTGTSLSRHVMA